jgi:hypothetical protein
VGPPIENQGSVMADITVTMRGPLFSGATEASLTTACHIVQAEVAAQASADVHMWMNHFFQHPTPYYETQVVVQDRADTTVVTDQGVIYGPWLAGFGTRNKTSRFKGYAHWRLAVQDAKTRTPGIVAAVFRTHGGT